MKTIDDIFLDPEHRDIAPRAGQIGFRRMTLKAGTVDEAARTIHFLCSTDDLDLYDEVIEHGAMEESLADFMLNPVMPVQHQYSSSSGAPTVAGSWVKVWYSKDGLEGIAQFATTALGEEYWQLYRAGHMRAVSIGFRAIAHELRDLKIGGVMRRTRVHTKARLLEISLVTIPANPSALARAGMVTSGDGGGEDRLTRLETIIEKLLNVHERQSDPSLAGVRDDAGNGDRWAHFMDDSLPGDDTASRAADDEADAQEINDALRRSLEACGSQG